MNLHVFMYLFTTIIMYFLCTRSNGSLVGPATPVDNSLWGQIEQFYSDKNNMAMYLVLPLIVLVYGGCSLIFCIYKCMGYCKKSKRRKDRQLLIKENRRRSIVTQRQVDNRPRSTASIHPEITQTTEQKTRTTPLPWEVPDNSETKVKQMDARSKHGNTMPQKGPKTHTGKTPPPPYQEVEDVIYLSGPKQPGYPTSGYQPKKQEYSPLELTKQLLRIGDEEKNLMRGRKKRLVFTTDWTRTANNTKIWINVICTKIPKENNEMLFCINRSTPNLLRIYNPQQCPITHSIRQVNTYSEIIMFDHLEIYFCTINKFCAVQMFMIFVTNTNLDP